MRIIAVSIFFVTLLSVYIYVFHYKRVTCKLCGANGKSEDIQESIRRNTLVKELKFFKILTDSLTYVKTNNKSFFIERKFRHGENNALKTVVSQDSSDYLYQFGFSPASGRHLVSKHNCYCDGNFYSVPDTVRCELWSYSINGEKIKKIGDAVIF
jgi:hypothetical protein